MEKKRLEEIKVEANNARKSLAKKLKTLEEETELLRKSHLVMEALDELLKENADFRKQFESKLAELSQKEETAKQRARGTGEWHHF